jgi:hypothetical protein
MDEKFTPNVRLIKPNYFRGVNLSDLFVVSRLFT